MREKNVWKSVCEGRRERSGACEERRSEEESSDEDERGGAEPTQSEWSECGE